MVFNKSIKILLVVIIIVSQVSRSVASDNMEKLFIGIMGAALGSAAQKNANQKQTSNPAPIIQNNLVRRAQVAFKTLGFYSSTIDGKLGSNTMAAAQLYVDKYKIRTFSFAENQDILNLEAAAEKFVKRVPEPKTNSEFFGFNKVALAIGSYKSLGEVGLGITEFYQKNKLALSDVQFSIFSTNNGHYITTLGVGDVKKCARLRTLGVRRQVIPSDSICTTGDGFRDAFIFRDGEIRPSKNWFALNLISVGVPPVPSGYPAPSTTETGLARGTIEKDAKITLAQLKDFAREAGRFNKPLEISKLVTSLEKEIKVKNLQKITLNFNKLKELLKTENQFLSYRKKVELAAKVAKNKAVNTALINLKKYKAFITSFVSEKPFDEKSSVLISMAEEIDNALTENDLDQLIAVFDGIAKKLSALALYNDAEKFKITKTEDVETIQAEALANEALLAEATEIIDAIESYMKEGQKFLDVRGISRGFVKLRRAVESKENLAISIANIKKVYETDEAFREFFGREKRATEVAEAEALKEASDRVLTLTGFIAEIVDENPLLPNIDMLWEADDTAKDLLARGDTALILGFYSEAMDLLTQMSLKKDYDSYLARVELESKRKTVAMTQAKAQEEKLGEAVKALANEALLAEATEIIDAIESYMKEGQKFLDVRGISRGFAELKEAISSGENLAISIAKIKKVYETDEAFREFFGREKRATEVAEAEALKEASDRVLTLTGFIEEIVDENPLLPNIKLLWEADDTAKDLLARGDTALILGFYSEAMDLLTQMSLKKDYDSYLARVELESKSETVAKTKAEARMKQLSIDNLRKQGDRLIEDIEKFEQENEFTLSTNIRLARLMSAYESVPKDNDEEEDKLSEAIRLLRLAVKGDQAFQDFRVREIGFRAAKESDSLALAYDEAKFLINFIETEISKNLSKKVLRSTLIGILDLVKSAVTERNSKTLLIAIDEGKRNLDNLNLDLLKKFNSYKASIGVNSQLKAIITATNGLAITALNTDILSGDKRDIIALENKTGGAPNILRDLLGTIVFSDNKASICWAGKPAKIGLAEGAVINSLKGMGVSKIGAIESCEKDKFGDVDIILLKRGTFLTQNLDYAAKLVQWFEKEDLMILDTWFWEDFEEKMLADKNKSNKNLKGLNEGVLNGYGFIKLNNSSQDLCTVIDNPTDENIHEVYLNAKIDEIELWISKIETQKNSTKEKTFARAQKGTCRIIYASAEDLKNLISGLNEQAIPFELSSLWVTQEALGIIENKLTQKKITEERDLVRLRQEIEAEETLREELLKNAAIEANKKQAELRSEYSQEANGAINRIRYLLDAGFRPGEFVYKKSSEELFETELSFNRTFTKTARWWRIKESSLWELSEYSFEIFDYGTADWQGRRLETITGELNLKIKNPALGKRDKKCLLISVMIDDEFNFLRDSNETNCSNKQVILYWQKARNFESRWVAN